MLEWVTHGCWLQRVNPPHFVPKVGHHLQRRLWKQWRFFSTFSGSRSTSLNSRDQIDLIAQGPKGNLLILRLKKGQDLGGLKMTSSKVWCPRNIHFPQTWYQGWNAGISSMLLGPVTLTRMDSQDGPFSKCQLSRATATSINTVTEDFTKTPGADLRLVDIFLFNSGEKRLTYRWSWTVGLFLPTADQRNLSMSGLGTLACWIPWGPYSLSLSPFPLDSILRLTDFSCSASLFLKVSFPFYCIIFRTISLINFQDMSSPPFAVSHISDDNELMIRRQEESVQHCGGWLELDEI